MMLCLVSMFQVHMYVCMSSGF